MELSYHITFKNGSNPYCGKLTDAKEVIKAVNKWVKSTGYNFNNQYDLFNFQHGYCIRSTASGTWVTYKKGKYCDTALKEYTYLANAVKFLEKEIQKGLDKQAQT